MGRTEAHIGSLDGLRAIAIVLVLLYHLTPGRDPDLGLRALPFKLAEIGWSGVDLFFVLSGFLITGRLLAARDTPHRFRDFYARRALRIFPLYYGVLLAVLVGFPMVSRAIELAPLREQLPYWLYYSNFIAPRLELERFVSLGHFWSLAIEEQFYVLWPAVIFLCSARTAKRVCIAIAAGAPLLRLVLATSGFEWPATYGWTPCRADGLALGALLALVHRDGWTRSRMLVLSSVALLATAPFMAWTAWRHNADFVVKSISSAEGIAIRTLLPTAVTLAFAAFLICSLELAPLRRALSGPIFRALARYSYGMYVAHFLLVPSLMAVLMPRLAHWSPNAAATAFFFVASAISLALAIASYHGYESHFLRLKTRFGSG